MFRRCNYHVLKRLIFLICLCAPAVDAAESQTNDFPWKFRRLANGGEETQRVYLLLTSRDQVQVQSNCIKEGPGEARYGSCMHRLHFVPSGKTFVLTQGEDVVSAHTPFGDVATINYGCCAGPDTITFYDFDMKPIGTLSMPNARSGGWSEIDLDNFRNKKMYMENSSIGGCSGDVILEKAADNQVKCTPVDNEFTDNGPCEGWFLHSFRDENDKVTLTFTGEECDDRLWSGTCRKTDKEYKCQLNPNKPSK